MAKPMLAISRDVAIALFADKVARAGAARRAWHESKLGTQAFGDAHQAYRDELVGLLVASQQLLADLEG